MQAPETPYCCSIVCGLRAWLSFAHASIIANSATANRRKTAVFRLFIVAMICSFAMICNLQRVKRAVGGWHARRLLERRPFRTFRVEFDTLTKEESHLVPRR